MTIDEKFMKQALREADKAEAIDEVPVGCVIVWNGKILARAHNLRETRQQATAHAEILCIEKACRKIGFWRLEGCTLYVTLEPCPMCAGACIVSRMERIVYGAYDPKSGCCGSLYDLPTDTRFNHRPQVEGGVLKEECSEKLSRFFQAKRKKVIMNSVL